MEYAEDFLEEVQFEELEDDMEKQFALQRAFEVIGEATKQLDSDLRDRYRTVPRDDMAGMRNVLINKYFAVDLEVVWDTLHNRFTRIKPHLCCLLDDLPSER